MEKRVWSVELPPSSGSNYTAVDYYLNGLGIFAKTELRTKKSGAVAQMWGFRAGKNKIKGTDHLAQAQKRQALLWEKIREVVVSGQQITVRGNSKTEIVIFCSEDDFSDINDFIQRMITSHPKEKGPSTKAAGWLCWEQDEDWEAGDSLEAMVEAERNAGERFIEEDILEETILREK